MTRNHSAGNSLDAALTSDFATWSSNGLERTLRPQWQRRGAEVETESGRAIDFASNDYLGLATDSRLVAAVQRTVGTESVGATASRLIAGDHPEHQALERDIASFVGAPAALVFNNGYAANIGAIPAIVGAGDIIFADAYNHASLIDGCRLSRAAVHVYPHGDVSQLRTLLTAQRRSARRALIVTDGLFSMDGDLADLPALVTLAHEFDAWTYVDDAHAVGTIGGSGRGSAEHFGIPGAVDITVGTLGKAFGTAGAFVYGSEALRRHLLNRARSFVFSTAMFPAQAAASRAALAIVIAEPARLARLRANVLRARAGIAATGVSLIGVPGSQIIPVLVGDTDEAMRVGSALRAQGLLVGTVRPPTVAHGSARIRISVSAAHTDAQVDRLAAALANAIPVR
jgi:8-amino-7-oxononanoate synthase